MGVDLLLVFPSEALVMLCGNFSGFLEFFFDDEVLFLGVCGVLGGGLVELALLVLRLLL